MLGWSVTSVARGVGMAGLGIGPDEFALFRINDPDQRAEAIENVLAPARPG